MSAKLAAGARRAILDAGQTPADVQSSIGRPVQRRNNRLRYGETSVVLSRTGQHRVSCSVCPPLLTARRQTLPKQLATAHNPTPPGVERDDGDKERAKEKEPKEKKERDRREKAEKGPKEREPKEKVEREKRETEKRERERTTERGGRERETAEKGQQNEPKDGEEEPDKTATLKRERERRDERQREAEGDPEEGEKRSQEEHHRLDNQRKSKGEKQERPKPGKDGLKQKERAGPRPQTGAADRGPRKEREKEAGKCAGARDVPPEVGRASLQCLRAAEKKRGAEKKMRPHPRGGTSPDRTGPPSKKTKRWTQDLPSSSSESDSSLPSEDEGQYLAGAGGRVWAAELSAVSFSFQDPRGSDSRAEP